MVRKTWIVLLIAALGVTGLPILAFAAEGDAGSYLGNWALNLPGGAGWLNVRMDKDFAGKEYLEGDILWYGGSVEPVNGIAILHEKSLMITRVNEVPRKKDAKGKITRQQNQVTGIQIHVSGDELQGLVSTPEADGLKYNEIEFTGKRIPPPPAAPDLSKVKFGDWVNLFDGKDMDKWELTDSKATSGWRVENGLLVNEPKQVPGKHISYGNLRTKQEFEDFNITLEVNLPKKGNSGVYLRGIYEVQVEDSYGLALDSYHMGGIYSRITPTMNAEKPAGEWQTLDITLADRHVTVILNGKKIIDNQPLLGCTGGALSSDEFKPGPIYVQGDHTGITYRNIKIRPIVK